jgi:hypothetical protein
VTRTFWLSFVDDTRPKGERFLGVCIIDVDDEDAADVKEFQTRRFPNAVPGSEWLGAAIRKSHQMCCNPGGVVGAVDITNAAPPAPLVKNRLLSHAQLEALGLEPATQAELDCLHLYEDGGAMCLRCGTVRGSDAITHES